MNKNSNTNSRTSNKNVKVPNYDANQSRIKINKIIEEKNAEKMRRKIKLIFTFFIIGIILSLSYVILKLPYFNIAGIQVEGNDFYDEGQIVDLASGIIGKNVFVETFFVKDDLTLPYIKEIKKKVIFPNKIKLVVTERQGKYFAYDKDNKVYYLLDEEGYILKKTTDTKERLESEILTYGISFDTNAQIGLKIDDAYVKRLQLFEKIKSKVEVEMKEYTITSLNLENSLTTISLNDKLNVEFNTNNDINYSISLLKVIIKNLPEGSAGVIDMTKNDPIFSSY